MLLSGRSANKMRALLEANTKKIQDPEFWQLMCSAFDTPIVGHNYRGYGVTLDETQNDPHQWNIQVARTSLKPGPIWYVFSGMGSNVQGIEKTIMRSCPSFEYSLNTLSSILTKTVGINLLENLGSKGAVASADVRLAFVALTVVQIAFIDASRYFGVEPSGFIGYSAGEIACGYAGGCLTKEEALLLSYHHGTSYKEAEAIGGSMATAGLTWDEAIERCPLDVYPVCKNAKINVTIGGKRADVELLVKQLKENGTHAKEVQSYGIAAHVPKHSDRLFSLTVQYFEDTLKGSSKPRSERWISPTLSQSEWAAKSCSQYYVNNAKNPVLFYDALMHIPKDAIVVEIGLSALLSSLIQHVSVDPKLR